MKKLTYKAVFLMLIGMTISCASKKPVPEQEIIKYGIEVAYETGRQRQEFAVKAIYPDLDWIKIDSVYQTFWKKK